MYFYLFMTTCQSYRFVTYYSATCSVYVTFVLKRLWVCQYQYKCLATQYSITLFYITIHLKKKLLQ